MEARGREEAPRGPEEPGTLRKGQALLGNAPPITPAEAVS